MAHFPGQLFLKGFIVCLIINTALGNQLCKSAGCEGSSCPEVSCVNGVCSPGGGCECRGCYEGETCNIYVDYYPPAFLEHRVDVPVTTETEREGPVYHAKVTDDDRQVTCQGEVPCDCADVIYSLNTTYGDIFRIDPNTGDVYFNAQSAVKQAQRYPLAVKAKNINQQSTTAIAKMELVVQIVTPEDDLVAGIEGEAKHEQDKWSNPSQEQEDDLIHSRQRRSFQVSEAIPDNVTFYLEKIENTTTMYIGSKVHFKLGIHFPRDTTDMLVELFTPDNETTVMILCGVQITSIGSNLSPDMRDNIQEESKDNSSANIDRAIIKFGNVTNNESNTTDSDASMIVIEWDAVMIDNNETQNGSTYWVSAGAEYNNEDEVWVGQASFTTILEDTSNNGLPDFNFTGPSEIEIGASAKFRVDMYIPYPSVTLAFDAFAPLNAVDVMSVCSVVIADTGENYKCLRKDKFRNVLHLSDSKLTNARGRIDLGTVINTGTRDPATNTNERNRISVEFVLRMSSDQKYADTTYWVGAAVEIGTNQIWAGQLNITAVNRTQSNMTETPVFSLSGPSSGDDVYVGQVAMFELSMELPKNSESAYSLEVLSPFNESEPVFRLCTLEIISTGDNVPCKPDTKPVLSSRNNGTYNDRMLWDLGKLMNTGHKSNSEEDKIKFRIVAEVLNHTLVGAGGGPFWLTVGVQFDLNRLWVGQKGVNISPENATSSNDTTPTFSLSYAFGSDHVPVGGVADIRMEITTQPYAAYTPMDMEIILPFENDTAQLSVCRAEVLFAGRNMPCFQRETVNASIGYSSKGNNTSVYDKATIKLGRVCNTGYYNGADDNKIVIRIIVKVEDHVAFQNGSDVWVSAGIMYSETRMWVGQIALYVLKDTPQITAEPYINTTRFDAHGDGLVGMGMNAIYRTTIKSARQSIGHYRIVVTSQHNGLSICNVRIAEAGFNIPCVDTTTKANYTEKHPDQIRDKKAVLDLGYLTNVGDSGYYQNDTIFDNDTVSVEIVVQVSGDTSLVTAGNFLSFSVDVELNGQSVQGADVKQVEAGIITTNTSNATIPTFQFNIAPNFNGDSTNQIAKGETVKFYLDVIPQPNTANKLMVKFLTPVNESGVMEVCSADVIFVGANLPCFKKDLFKATFEKRQGSDYNDIGNLDLGIVCHSQIESGPEADKIRIEAIARLTRVSSLSEGDRAWFSSTVRINDDQIFVSQLAINVTSFFNESYSDSTNSSLALNVTNGPLEWRPGEIYTVQVKVEVPANCSVYGMVDIDLPVNESAVMTVRDIRFLSSGDNLACLGSHPELDFIRTFNSTKSTSQNDNGFLDLGIITNTGRTYRIDKFKEEDNSFWLEIEVQMADAAISDNGTDHKLSIGARIGSSVIILDKQVVVVRDGTETPNITLTADVNNTLPYQTPGTIEIDCVMQHDNLSRAEGYNVTATLYFPPFISFKAITTDNMTLVPTVKNTTGFEGIQMVFERLYFTDKFTFTVSLDVSAVSTDFPKGVVQPDATTPYETGCNIIWRANHVNDTGTFFVTQLDSLAYRVEGPSGSQGCQPEQSLGMEVGGSIKDCQITSSHSPDSSRPAKDARSGSGSGWTSAARSGNFEKYLQVSFGNVTRVTKVTLEYPTYASNERVKTYQIKYSDDGYNWELGETVTVTPSLYTTSALHTVSAPTDARYIRLVFTEPEGGEEKAVAVRAKFDGCTMSDDMTPEQVCQVYRIWDKSGSARPEFSSRSFLAVNGDVYFCDEIPDSVDNSLQCYASDGTTFRALDKNVVNVIGYDQEEGGVLYGIAQDKQSYVASEDQGTTWFSVSPERFNQADSKGTFMRAKEVPWVNDADMSSPSPAATYTVGSWGANYNGMYHSGILKSDWTKCCST